MINLYAYAYPATMHKFPGYILTKVGDSIRDVVVRMNEQAAEENEGKQRVGVWPNCRKIKRDHDVHNVLKSRGLYHDPKIHGHRGTEWFKIPGDTIEAAYTYLDNTIASLEGEKVRISVKLRKVQERTLDQAMKCFEGVSESASIIANLCPRFGKTIWALSLFNRVHERYGNQVMLLPAYWLSVHTSFIDELDRFDEFKDIVQIDVVDPSAVEQFMVAVEAGQQIVIPISLHGDYTNWCKKHEWLADIPNDNIFMFADEGDFGTHAENQIAKLDFLFN